SERKRSEPRLDAWLGGQGWLEPVSDFTQGVVGGFYGALGKPGRTLRDLVHGVWPLGHPLHPALTDVPLGAWVAAVVLGFASYVWPAIPAVVSPAVLAVGIVGGLAAAAAGYTDFHDTFGLERRTAMLHGLTMTLAMIVMIVSLAVSIWSPGARGTALAIATIGLAITLFGAYVGGHLTFRFGTMVDRHAFTEFPADWSDAGTAADYPEGKLSLAHAGDIPVLVVRVNGKLNAVANTCSHAGGPLNEGKLEGSIVTCPWHGSRFCVRDGAVKGGPATFAQPVFFVREESGRVKVKAAAAGH
ncbi:MAG TPA: Rieske 2Fe-2S domain-containing protein, partial [Candidatus Dormibacteraeota bacterium]|nr:Rieske 2Fe-2S domain-containing protein [Candidatus Dormibacteraeota bacterium]